MKAIATVFEETATVAITPSLLTLNKTKSLISAFICG